MTGQHIDGDPDRLSQQLPATMPDPDGATTPQEFVRRLQAFKAWSGSPSLRELERRTGLPRSTLSGDLSHQRSRLPPLERVLALVTAFGASAEELARWQSAWQRIQMRQQSAEPPVPASRPTVEPPTPDVAPQVLREPEWTRRHRFAHRRLRWPVLSISGLLAALLAVALTATPVTGGRSAAAGTRPPFPVDARTPDRCGYLGRISDKVAASPLDEAATTGESVQIKSPVAKGDTLIVTLALAGAGTGPITVRDTAGNRYRAIRDETTDGTRLTVFALFDARPLDSLDQITFLWPSSKHDYTAVDEFRGVRSADPVHGPGAPGESPISSKGTEPCGRSGVTTALRNAAAPADR
ncbi:helix-turn-helix domain-containing protein [Kitasatospora sp. NPDC056138]|uniref:helix-turn-helix domain-containing protein n=1 Tax=Kitasatospora sp. NPDC056138 TaxID=3345724 RepID=UPI0035DAE9B8